MSKSALSDLSRINLLDTPDVSVSDDYLICERYIYFLYDVKIVSRMIIMIKYQFQDLL